MNPAVSTTPSVRSVVHPTREAAVDAFVSDWRLPLIDSLAARFEASVGRDAISDAVDQVVAEALAGSWRSTTVADGRTLYSEKELYGFVQHAASNDLRNYLGRLAHSAAPVYGVAPDLVEQVLDRHSDGAEESWIVRETSSQLREALAALGEEEQQVLALRHVDGCERSKIAVLLGISERQVKRHLERANKRLRDHYLSVQAGETCDDGRLVVHYAFGLSVGRDARRAEAHIGHCADCRRRYARAQAYRRAVAGLVPFPLTGHGAESAAGLLDQLRLFVARLFGQSGEDTTRAIVGARGGAGAAAAGGAKLLGICAAGVALTAGGIYCVVNGLPSHHNKPPAKTQLAQRAPSSAPAPIAAAAVTPPSREHAVLMRAATHSIALKEHRATKRAAARRAAAKRKAGQPDEFFSPYASPGTTTTSAPAPSSATTAPAAAQAPTTSTAPSSSEPNEFPLP